jgi:hypothetical protein
MLMISRESPTGLFLERHDRVKVNEAVRKASEEIE